MECNCSSFLEIGGGNLSDALVMFYSTRGTYAKICFISSTAEVTRRIFSRLIFRRNEHRTELPVNDFGRFCFWLITQNDLCGLLFVNDIILRAHTIEKLYSNVICQSEVNFFGNINATFDCFVRTI